MKKNLIMRFVNPVFFAVLLLLFGGTGFAQTVPTNPTISVNTLFSTVDLTWSADNADGYMLYYAPYPDATPISNIDMGTQTSLSTDLPDLPSYSYFVAIKAYNSAGESDFSNIEYFDPFQPTDIDIVFSDRNETFINSQDLYMSHHKMSKPVKSGSFTEKSTAQYLAFFNSNRLCGGQTGVLEHVALGENHWVYVENGVDVYYLSEHPNSPLYRMYYCDGTGFEEGVFGPVTKAKDVTVTTTGLEDQVVWSDDGIIDNAYLDCNLTFSGYIWVRVTNDTGDFDHFNQNVMQPLLSAAAWDSTEVVMDRYFALNGGKGPGYFATARVITNLCAQKAADEILGKPAIQITGRRVDVKYTQSPTCGAFVAPGVWKEFDCYNLAAIGKTTNEDPFTPAWWLIGGYWQWGRKGPDPSQWYDTNTPHFAHGPNFSGANEGEISNWDVVISAYDNDPPNDSWNDNTKTANDPCPVGYRVPTPSQWEGVINNNILSNVGVSWGLADADPTNYNNAMLFGNDLMLPAAGRRYGPQGGKLYDRGTRGQYSSSSLYSDPLVKILYFWSGYAEMNFATTNDGCSVRCIAE